MIVALALFGIPNHCRIKKDQTVCYNSDLKITTLAMPTRRLLPLLFADGKDSSVRLIVTHDKTKTSCFEAEINVNYS